MAVGRRTLFQQTNNKQIKDAKRRGNLRALPERRREAIKRNSHIGDYDLFLSETHSEGIVLCTCGYEMVVKYT